MPLDDFLPEYDFVERHGVVIDAPTDVVRQAIESWRPESSLLWRALLTMRGLGSPRGSLREWAEGEGFLCLAETEIEVVYGQIGRFWHLREASAFVSPKTLEEFLVFDDPSCAATAMSIGGEVVRPGTTRLVTETRIRALGPGARRRFRLYWLLIRPFSGLLRGAMLRGIKKEAMRTAGRRP